MICAVFSERGNPPTGGSRLIFGTFHQGKVQRKTLFLPREPQPP